GDQTSAGSTECPLMSRRGRQPGSPSGVRMAGAMASASSDPAGPDTSADAGRRLDSWKEIAAYFRRNERTVRRWEKAEGLPIHRHLHDIRGSVFAYAAELDAWRAGRATGLKQPSQ